MKKFRESGGKPDARMYDRIISAELKSGSLYNATKLVDMCLEDKIAPTSAVFKSIFSATQIVNEKDAKVFLEKMIAAGAHMDPAAYYMTLQQYGKDGNHEKAEEIFAKLPKAYKTFSAYVHLIDAYGNANQIDKMMEVFRNAKENNIRDDHVFAAVCKHLITANKLSEALQVASEYKDGMNAVIAEPLVKHFCTSGNMAKAEQLHKWLQGRNMVDINIMNDMIVGYLKQQEEYKARRIFYEIRKDPTLQVTVNTFVPFIMHYSKNQIGKSVVAYSMMKKQKEKLSLPPSQLKYITTALKNHENEEIYQKFVALSESSK